MDNEFKEKAMKRIQLTRILTGQTKVPFLKGRPDRTGKITQEDIIDLQILLNTAKSFEDFLYNS